MPKPRIIADVQPLDDVPLASKQMLKILGKRILTGVIVSVAVGVVTAVALTAVEATINAHIDAPVE